MKPVSIRVPDALFAEIEAEARARKLSKSDIVRERLTRGTERRPSEAIADLIGSIDGLPPDLGVRKKHYLKTTGYGRKDRQQKRLLELKGKLEWDDAFDHKTERKRD